MIKDTEKRDALILSLLVVLMLGLTALSFSLWKAKKELNALKAAQQTVEPGYSRPLPAVWPGKARHRVQASLPQMSAFDAWDPFEEMDRMQQHINRLFRQSMNRAVHTPAGNFSQLPQFEPGSDMSETETEYIVKIDLPGMEKDKINVEVKDNMLSVSGERKAEKEQNGQGFYSSELSYGSFSRSFPIPGDVNPEKMTAEYRDGVLTVKLAKLNPGKKGNEPGSKVTVS